MTTSEELMSIYGIEGEVKNEQRVYEYYLRANEVEKRIPTREEVSKALDIDLNVLAGRLQWLVSKGRLVRKSPGEYLAVPPDWEQAQEEENDA